MKDITNIHNAIKYEKDFNMFKGYFINIAFKCSNYKVFNQCIFSMFDLKYYFCTKTKLKNIISSLVQNISFNDFLDWINHCNNNVEYYEKYILENDDNNCDIIKSVKFITHYIGNEKDFYDLKHLVLYQSILFDKFVWRKLKEKYYNERKTII